MRLVQKNSGHEFLSEELLNACRGAERTATDSAADRFLAAQNELVAQARLRTMSSRKWSPFRWRYAMASAGVLAVVALVSVVGLSEFSPAGTAQPTGVRASDDAEVVSIASDPSSARSIESQILAAKAGSVIKLEAGKFETAMTVNKAVRLVAVDGVVRIGVNAAKPAGNQDGNLTQNAS